MKSGASVASVPSTTTPAAITMPKTENAVLSDRFTDHDFQSSGFRHASPTKIQLIQTRLSMIRNRDQSSDRRFAQVFDNQLDRSDDSQFDSSDTGYTFHALLQRQRAAFETRKDFGKSKSLVVRVPSRMQRTQRAERHHRHRHAGFRIQRAGGLVAQQHFGTFGDSSGNCHPLLLTAGHIAG